jgi:GWxTD domain-containing protein
MKKLLMLLLAFVIVVPAYAAKLEPETSVLMTTAENDAYKKLKNDDERKNFEKEFWDKRDPTPGTAENEYRDEIKQRIKDVAKAMRRNDAWETDMGRTLILLGPPAKTQAGADKPNEAEATWYPEPEEGGRSADTGTTATQGEAKRIFLYQTLPAGVATGETKVEFLQVRNRWSFRETKKSQDLLEKARVNELTRLAKMRESGQTTSPQAAPITQAAPVTPQQPAVVPVTPEVKAALDATAGGTAPTAVTFESVADSFQTSAGEIFATVAVNTSAASPTSKTGIRVVDSTGKVVHEAELPFTTAGETAGYFQTKVPIPAPGEYNVALVLANGTEIGGTKHTLTVPDATKFNASSIILSKKFTQLPEAKPEKEPYTFGKIKVYPNINGAFTKADDLIVVYEVYNPQIDAATSKPNLEAVYTFEREGGKPKKTPPAAPNGLVTGKKMTISTSYPLQTFAAGKYKLNVEITDKATGEKAVREAAFEVQ